jgi:hypothetical protein
MNSHRDNNKDNIENDNNKSEQAINKNIKTIETPPDL